MQWIYRDAGGQNKPTPQELQRMKERSDEEDKKMAEEFKKSLGIDRSIFKKEETRTDDLHLQLSKKYMIYKEYAERTILNP